MREALHALTNRGRAFLAAGITATMCAFVLGYDELVRVGALLLLLPLVTAFFVGRSRYRLGLVRLLSPQQVAVGQQAHVQLELTNDGRMPTGLLLLEEQIPYVLGSRPRFVVDRMGQHWRRNVVYTVRSDVRGRFTIGPMSVRLHDPFGLIELERTFSSRTSLTVVPTTIPLPHVPLAGAWTGSGDNRPRSFATGSAEDVTVREYRQGDDLRRVHWRSSAKAGDLMVRREEQPWQSRATVLLDNRGIAHRGTGSASSLEHAVSITASVAVHLAQRGFAVRLVTATGEEPGASWHEHHGPAAAETRPLMESLALLREAPASHLDTEWLHDAGHAGLLIAVLGSLSDHDKPALARMRHSAANALAVVLEVDGWAGTAASARAERAAAERRHATGQPDAVWLGSFGWRAVPAGPHDPVPAVWRSLGLLGRARPAAAVPSTPLPTPEALALDLREEGLVP